MFVRAALACLTLCATAPSSSGQYENGQLELVWQSLGPSERVEVVEWFRLELSGQDLLVVQLVDLVMRRADVDPGFWPKAGSAPFFDPGGARQRLPSASERSQALRARVLPAVPPLWTYDFATRRLVLRGDPEDPERVLKAALAGRHPDEDYVRAAVERMLDDGRLQDTFSALAHGFSEPDGAVHADVTLYDVLAADAELSLDAVDAVGVLRWILGAESPWSLPIDAEREPDLRRAVAEHFESAREFRATIQGLARAYLEGDVLAELVQEAAQLQSLWVSADMDPEKLAARVPGPGQRERFFADWSETFRLEKLRTNGTRRQSALAYSAEQIRAVFVRVLDEFGAFDSIRPPAREPPTAQPVTPVEPPFELDPAADALVLERILELDPRRRDALVVRCVAAARESGAIQVELVREWVERAGIARDALAPPTDHGAHDAKVYGGGSPRRLVERGDRLWDQLVEQIDFDPPPPWPRRVDYEFASGKLVSVPPPTPAGARKKSKPSKEQRGDPHDLELLLRGILPDQDLAVAAVARALDAGGGLRPEALFFAHLYCDREAHAYSGITLGDAWSSDFEFEVPDVDALAYIREIWRTDDVLPPLSQADHARWYPRMGASLKDLRSRIQVVRALAAVWFEGRPDLAHGYDASIDILHATIAGCGEDVQVLSERLERDRAVFVQNALRDVARQGNAAWNAGNARRDALVAGARKIRHAVLAVLAAEGLAR